LRIGWFSTGRGPTSRRLLAATREEIAAGRLDARIAAVFCNREPGEDQNTDEFLRQVRGYDVPLVCLSSRDFRRARGGSVVRKRDDLPRWRREYDREVIRLLDPYPFDIGVLAGYMLIFCEEAAARWDMLNLHPAEPGGPKGVWQDVIWELIETRAERAGVMIHLATPELDAGPPASYCTYPIRGAEFDPLWETVSGRRLEEVKPAEGEENPLFREIRRQGVAREIPLVVETLRAFADGRLRIREKRLVDKDGNSTGPLDLSEAIETAVASASA
jgi:folate-dependent phosphoribosylglycinamide formyltransferase PurN